jgi:hypothetical protein
MGLCRLGLAFYSALFYSNTTGAARVRHETWMHPAIHLITTYMCMASVISTIHIMLMLGLIASSNTLKIRSKPGLKSRHSESAE